MQIFTIRGNLVDVHQQRIYPAMITVSGDRITGITELPQMETPEDDNHYILPGFIDAHVHIESSMLVPSEFARLAVVHGTVATVSDPHEIANICGMDGVEYMITNGKSVNFRFNFGAPSCVPATSFETAGAVLNAAQVEELMRRDDILYLSEMMNYPGVLNGDSEVMQKIAAAKNYGKPVDGHAPGLRGHAAATYINAGISTDHECTTYDEALEKLELGMKIIIREGSAAKNFEALIGLLNDYPDMMMFCSDDKHPDSLVEGHIDRLCARAMQKGIDIFKVLKAACVNPVKHYHLQTGLLRKNDFADFIVVKDLQSFAVLKTFINGSLVAENGRSLLPRVSAGAINHFHNQPLEISMLADIPERGSGILKNIPVIEALDGQLITNRITGNVEMGTEGIVRSEPGDLLMLVVVNRYRNSPPAMAFISNFGLETGAIASSVAHDSHNIVAVGKRYADIVKAVNLVMEHQGGISCTGDTDHILPLPVAGLMSSEDGYEVARMYSAIDRAAKQLGSGLSAPFMTLSFMALLVIPHLKLSDRGLFDGDAFRFIPAFEPIAEAISH